jgi:hypothetical protein
VAIQKQGFSGTVQEVDATFRAGRISIRPPEVINWNSIAGISGLLTGVAAAGPVFSFRNTGANLIMVRRVGVGFITTTAFTTAQGLYYNMIKANSFSASDSGGTALYTAGANKHRNAFTNIASAPDIRVSTTAALTAGTRTLEGQPLATACGSSTAVGTGLPVSPLFSHDPGDYPLILAQNEGFVITNGIAMGAAGVINLMVNLEYAEATAF